MLNQVSVFAENTKGALRKMTAVLAAADVNIQPRILPVGTDA